MAGTTRATLLQRLKILEDDRSWREFFDSYWRLIFSVALKAGLTDAEAQDVVQETVIAVARKMPEFEYVPGRDSFKGWLLQLTRWKIADQFRKRQLVAPPPPRAPDDTHCTTFIERIPDPASLDLTAAWDEEWKEHLLKAALKRVKQIAAPQHYAVFVEYALHKTPAHEVARNRGLSIDQVYLIKHRVSDLVRSEIKRLELQLV